MTAIAQNSPYQSTCRPPAEVFEEMLPSIRRVASFRFRHVPPWHRQELISDVVAKAFVAFVRLVERGKAALAYPTVLAKLAIKQIHDGRHVGAKRNTRDAFSPVAQRRKGFLIELLSDRIDKGDWEQLTDGLRASPADIAACRIDFQCWLGRLEMVKRHIALRLACGDTTSEAAERFRVSKARISQLRQELRADWEAFQALPSAM
jgi:hypothetical protein